MIEQSKSHGQDMVSIDMEIYYGMFSLSLYLQQLQLSGAVPAAAEHAEEDYHDDGRRRRWRGGGGERGGHGGDDGGRRLQHAARPRPQGGQGQRCQVRQVLHPAQSQQGGVQ